MGDAPISVLQKFTDEEKHRISDLYLSGKTQEEIAIEFGVSRRTIMKLCVLLGLYKSRSEAQKSLVDPIFLSMVKKLRVEGKTIHEIVRVTGRSVAAVGRIVKKLKKISR